MNDVIKKIKADILDRSMKKNFCVMPTAGNASHEFDYRVCKSGEDGMDDYYFVVSKVLKYRNGSMDDYIFSVYAYDKEGNYVQDNDLYDKCKGKFFKTLVDV